MGNYYISNQNDSDYLKHFGIQGMKWGQRRYQYEDGSLTPEGREHYGIGERTARAIADIRSTYTAKRKAKQRNKSLKNARKNAARARKEKKKLEEAAAKRKKILDKNYVREDARKTYLNLDNMSNQEVRDAQQRLMNEKSIREYAMAEIDAERKANPARYEKAAQFIANAVKVTNDVVTVAQNVRKVADAFGITGNSDSNKKKDKGNNNSGNNSNSGGKKKNSTLDKIGQAIANNINQDTADRARRAKERQQNSNYSDNSSSKSNNNANAANNSNSSGGNTFENHTKKKQPQTQVQTQNTKDDSAYVLNDNNFTVTLSDAFSNPQSLTYGKGILEAMGLD